MKMSIPWRTIRKFIFIGIIGIIVWITILSIVRIPTNDRVWATDQAVLPSAEFLNETITVKNIRNFTYLSRDEFIANYYDKSVRLTDIVSVDYIVEPLASVAAAHTFLSFGFSDGSRIAISVEIRKEVGEEFSPLSGIFEAYELMYVVVDEHDALTLRAIYRDNPVYIYPTTATPEVAQKLFLSMLTRVNKLYRTPEFYNTLNNSCATNIADHINELLPKSVPWDYRLLLPKDSDLLAYELGFIHNAVPLAELRETYNASNRIKEFENAPDFSVRIRQASTTSDSNQ